MTSFNAFYSHHVGGRAGSVAYNNKINAMKNEMLNGRASVNP